MYQTRRSERRAARLRLTASSTRSRRAGSAISAAISAAASRCSGEGTGPASLTGEASASGQRSGDETELVDAEPPRDLGGPLGQARTPTPSRSCSPAPSRRGRPAPATRSWRSPRPTAAGQRSARSARSALPPKPGKLAAKGVSERFQGSPPRPGSARPESAERCVVVITVWSRVVTAAASTAAAAGVELGEDVVEEQQRRRGKELRLGEEQGEQGEPLLALRAEAPQVAPGGADLERRRDAGRARSCRARRRPRAGRSSAAVLGGSPR